jgi:hypothetical protein
MPRFAGIETTQIVKFSRGEGFSGTIDNDHLPAFARPQPRFRHRYEQTASPALGFFVVSFGYHLVGQASAPCATQPIFSEQSL